MTESQEKLEKLLLDYIERNTKELPPPEIAATIPAAAEVLIKLWQFTG